MKFGIRTPSLKRRVAARTSWKRQLLHRAGLKAPRGLGWATNPKKAAHNRVYSPFYTWKTRKEEVREILEKHHRGDSMIEDTCSYLSTIGNCCTRT